MWNLSSDPAPAHREVFMKNGTAEIQQNRAAWIAEHPFKGLTVDQSLRQSEELYRLFPLTREEDEERRKQKEITVEFVL
jgi:hypothetical protein